MAMTPLDTYTLDFDSPLDSGLQQHLLRIDTGLRESFGIKESQTAVGLFDLIAPRLAMLRPDKQEYAASLAKVAILLAYFKDLQTPATQLDPETRRDLGLMIKASSNEAAARFSREMGLARIQQVLNEYRLYDAQRGGGLWMGKHYGDNSERIGDPLDGHSHAATVRQLMRFYLLLEQNRLISEEHSAGMREIFASPDIPQDCIKFVKGLRGRAVNVRRKWGSWEDWLHDSAVVSGQGRHYILVALTHHVRGDDYLEQLALEVDTVLAG